MQKINFFNYEPSTQQNLPLLLGVDVRLNFLRRNLRRMVLSYKRCQARGSMLSFFQGCFVTGRPWRTHVLLSENESNALVALSMPTSACVANGTHETLLFPCQVLRTMIVHLFQSEGTPFGGRTGGCCQDLRGVDNRFHSVPPSNDHYLTKIFHSTFNIRSTL